VKKSRYLIVAILVASVASASANDTKNAKDAEDVTLDYSSRVDWERGVLLLEVSADIGNTISPGEARVEVEERVRREIGQAFCNALYEVNLDSYREVREAVEEDSRVLAALLDMAEKSTPLNVFLNTSLDMVTALYEFDFYPEIIKVFARHQIPYDPVNVIEFVPALDYSGIVIYAKGEYPVHGEDPAGKNPEPFHPALLPKLFDSEMELIAEAEMMDPEYLLRWGTFGYTDSSDYLLHKDRIGATPLFTMARAVFGDNRTDLVIPVDAANRILANPSNRELIRQGRILVICDLTAGD
jgi:hypothetical protein